jgi:putative transposase
LTARSNNQDWFSLPIEDCWEVYVKALKEIHTKYDFRTHAFVLMGNHYHWLVSTPKSNLGEGMGNFQTVTSLNIARLSNRINHVYGGRYKFSEIRNPVYYANAYRYVLQNPLRANIVNDVYSYKFSSLVDSRIDISVFEAFIENIPTGPGFKDWINRKPYFEIDEVIKKSLRRRVFEFPRDPKSKERISGLTFL